MKSNELIGKEVVGSGGWKVGKVHEVVFDAGSWKVNSIDVNLDGAVAKEFEMKKLLSKTTINLGVHSIRSIGDHVMLSISKDDVQGLAERNQL